MPRLRSIPVPLALATVGALVLGGCTGDTQAPRSTVRDFLGVTLVEQNGQKSCDRMTVRAQEAVARAGTPGSQCRENMERARLALGGERYGSGEQVMRGLEYEVDEQDDRATVTVTGAEGASARFRLVYDPETVGLYPADTPWRVDGGVEQLLKGPTAK